VRTRAAIPRLLVRDILSWIKDHHRRTGQLPDRDSGPIWAAPVETWAAIDAALKDGTRGLAGGTSLHGLCMRHFRKPGRRTGTVRVLVKQGRGRRANVVRRAKARAMRASGMTFPAIAKRLGIGIQGAWNIVNRT
jgi:hypothetical protein